MHVYFFLVDDADRSSSMDMVSFICGWISTYLLSSAELYSLTTGPCVDQTQLDPHHPTIIFSVHLSNASWKSDSFSMVGVFFMLWSKPVASTIRTLTKDFYLLPFMDGCGATSRGSVLAFSTACIRLALSVGMYRDPSTAKREQDTINVSYSPLSPQVLVDTLGEI